ncbi:MAG: BON domain-containing protein [bacterium]|nr:BON domain-containing protein [bacterium]
MRLKTIKNNFVKITLPAFFCAAVLSAAPGKPLSNEWIEGRIQGALAYNTYLDSSDLDAEMDSGIATLSGAVPSEIERDLAEVIAMNIDGVTSVQNKIKIDPELGPRSRPDSVQKMIDATTTAAVKTRLLTTKSMHDMKILISTKNGIVSLSGNVTSLPQKEAAEKIALNTRDVLDVNNELKIEDAKSLAEKANNASVNVAREVSDSWISSKIRTSLMFSSDFPGSSVSINTKKGTVTLKGYARNATQSAEIEKSINEFLGVREVKNDLKIKNS